MSTSSEAKVFNLSADELPSVSEIGSVKIARTTGSDTMHTHGSSVEIIFCRRGCLTYESLSHTYKLTPGCVFVSRPKEPHRIISLSKWISTYYTVVKLPRGDANDYLLPAKECNWLRRGFASLANRVFPVSVVVPQQFRAIINDCSSLHPHSAERTLRLRLGILNLLCEVLRCSVNSAESVPSSRINSLIEEMRQHPELFYSEDVLCERCAMSSSKLNAMFKRLTGLPPHAFLLSCRISHAKALLSSSSLPITSISDQLGFSSAKHFATTFHQLTGQPPSRYRRHTP